MILPSYARKMARYNLWRNDDLYRAAAALPDAERRKNRGAFFESIHGALNHLLWGDAMWLSRVSDAPKPLIGLSESARLHENWAELARARADMDARLIAWADALDETWLAGDLTWFSGALNQDLVKPRWLVVSHMFNHQTHHRGQVHAMLTAAGAKLGDTDLIFM